METLRERTIGIRDSIGKLAQACLAANELEAFQDLNKLIVDLSRVSQRFPNTNSTATPSELGDSIRAAKGEVKIFRERKGQRYEAFLDTSRIQKTGHGGPCILFQGQWRHASASAHMITNNSVNGWRNFWRYIDSSGIEQPIEQLRGIRRRGR